MHFQHLRQRLRLVIPVFLAVIIATSGLTIAFAQPPDPNAPQVQLKAGSFDPVNGEPAVPGDAPADNTKTYLIQFRGPVEDSWKTQLETMGVQLLDYVPDFAFLAKMDPSLKGAVKSQSFVRWIGPLKPAYKVAPGLLKRSGDVEIKVSSIQGADPAALSSAITAAGGQVLSAENGSVQARISAGSLLKLAKDDSVEWIDEFQQAKLLNDRSRAITQVSTAWHDYGLYGSGQIIGLADTGLDNGSTATINTDFRGRIVAAFARARQNDWSDLNGHGTHVAGSILGNGANSGSSPGSHSYGGSLAGMAPEAKLVMQSVGDASGSLTLPPDLNTLFQQSYDAGARIHSDSWGGGTAGDYDTTAAAVDNFIYKHPDMTIVFAAGNDGQDANRNGVVDAGSVTPPATAKNAISVGASEGNRPPGSGGYSSYVYSKFGFAASPIAGDYTGNNILGLAAFSSRGPTQDGRIKPDITAPGTNILSVHSSKTSDYGWGKYAANGKYEFMGGTSMATPIVAGSAALVREYFVKRTSDTTPSAALIKATILNGATEMTPGQYGAGAALEIPKAPNNAEGWGLLNLKKSLRNDSSVKMNFIDNKTGVGTSGSATYTVNVTNPTVGLRVMLVWSDYPGSPSAAKSLVNDLDLTVKGPNGTTLWGNGKTGGDRLNNVEGIRLTPTAGTYTITVKGYNVPSGSKQPFALSFIGGIQ